jgi:hypothetical protein
MRDLLIILGALLVLVLIISTLGGTVTAKNPEAFKQVNPLESVTPLNAGLMPTDISTIFTNLKKEESREELVVAEETMPPHVPEHFEETFSYAPVSN